MKYLQSSLLAGTILLAAGAAAEPCEIHQTYLLTMLPSP